MRGGGMFGQEEGGFMGPGGYGGGYLSYGGGGAQTVNQSSQWYQNTPEPADPPRYQLPETASTSTFGKQFSWQGQTGESAPPTTPTEAPSIWGGMTKSDAATAPTAPTPAGSWLQEHQGELTGLGALAGGVVGYRQAKSQQKGLGAAIKEIDPLKGKFMGEHKRHLGLAEAYRPGGRYSQYMAGQIMGQAAESAGQESQRMIASGITSPSMMRAMARQSRTRAQHALPGMELQLSQMALPYEQMGAQSLTQYGGVVEQLASLKGAKAAIDPWSSAISGASQGMMQAGQMLSSFMPV